MAVPLHDIFKADLDLILSQDQNRMDSVFPRCKENLFSVNHSLTYANYFCNNNSILETSLSETKMAESSAYKSSFSSRVPAISLIYIKTAGAQVLRYINKLLPI